MNLIQKHIDRFGVGARLLCHVLTWTKQSPLEWFKTAGGMVRASVEKELAALGEIVIPETWDVILTTREETELALSRLSVFAKRIPFSPLMLTPEEALDLASARGASYSEHLASRAMMVFPHQKQLPLDHPDVENFNPDMVHTTGENNVWFSGNRINSDARIASLQNEFYFWRSLGVYSNMLSPKEKTYLSSRESFGDSDEGNTRSYLREQDFALCPGLTRYFHDPRTTYVDMKHAGKNRFPLEVIQPAQWAEHVQITPEKLNSRITIASRLSGTPFVEAPRSGVLLVEVPKHLEIMLFGEHAPTVPDGVIYSIKAEQLKVLDREGYPAPLCYGDKIRATNFVPIKGTNVPLADVGNTLLQEIISYYAEGSLQSALENTVNPIISDAAEVAAYNVAREKRRLALNRSIALQVKLEEDPEKAVALKKHLKAEARQVLKSEFPEREVVEEEPQSVSAVRLAAVVEHIGDFPEIANLLDAMELMDFAPDFKAVEKAKEPEKYTLLTALLKKTSIARRDIYLPRIAEMILDILPLSEAVKAHKGPIFFALESGSLKNQTEGVLRIHKIKQKQMLEDPPFMVETRSMERVMENPNISNHVYQYLLGFYDPSDWEDIIPALSPETKAILEGTASAVTYAALTLYPRRYYEHLFNREILTGAIQEMFDGSRNIPEATAEGTVLSVIHEGRTYEGCLPRPGVRVIQAGGIDTARIRRMLTKYILTQYDREMHYEAKGCGGILIGMEDVPIGSVVVSPVIWNRLIPFMGSDHKAAMLYWPMKYAALFQVEVSCDWKMSGSVIGMNKVMHELCGGDDDGDNNFLIVEKWIVDAAPKVDDTIPVKDYLNRKLKEISFEDTFDLRSLAEKQVEGLYNLGQGEELKGHEVLCRIIADAHGIGGTFSWRDYVHAVTGGDPAIWMRAGAICHASLDGLKVSHPVSVPSIVINNLEHAARVLGVPPSTLHLLYDQETGQPKWYRPEKNTPVDRFKFEYQIFSRRAKGLFDTDADPLLERFQNAMNNPSTGFYGKILACQMRGEKLSIRHSITDQGLRDVYEFYRSAMLKEFPEQYVDRQIKTVQNILAGALNMRLDPQGLIIEQGAETPEGSIPLPLNMSKFAEFVSNQLKRGDGKTKRLAPITLVRAAVYKMCHASTSGRGYPYSDCLLGLIRYYRVKIDAKQAAKASIAVEAAG